MPATAPRRRRRRCSSPPAAIAGASDSTPLSALSGRAARRAGPQPARRCSSPPPLARGEQEGGVSHGDGVAALPDPAAGGGGLVGLPQPLDGPLMGCRRASNPPTDLARARGQSTKQQEGAAAPRGPHRHPAATTVHGPFELGRGPCWGASRSHCGAGAPTSPPAQAGLKAGWAHPPAGGTRRRPCGAMLRPRSPKAPEGAVCRSLKCVRVGCSGAPVLHYLPPSVPACSAARRPSCSPHAGGAGGWAGRGAAVCRRIARQAAGRVQCWLASCDRRSDSMHCGPSAEEGKPACRRQAAAWASHIAGNVRLAGCPGHFSGEACAIWAAGAAVRPL